MGVLQLPPRSSPSEAKSVPSSNDQESGSHGGGSSVASSLAARTALSTTPVTSNSNTVVDRMAVVANNANNNVVMVPPFSSPFLRPQRQLNIAGGAVGGNQVFPSNLIMTPQPPLLSRMMGGSDITVQGGRLSNAQPTNNLLGKVTLGVRQSNSSIGGPDALRSTALQGSGGSRSAGSAGRGPGYKSNMPPLGPARPKGVMGNDAKGDQQAKTYQQFGPQHHTMFANNIGPLVATSRNIDTPRIGEQAERTDSHETNAVPQLPIVQETITTGLVSISVHDTLTFDAELALHPELFKHKSGGALCAGDLVEIRVWNRRPGATSSGQSNSSSKRDLLPPQSRSGARSMLHSRNPSVVSSISNVSLMNTPRSSANARSNISVTPNQPPLPTHVGGDGLPSMNGPRESPASEGELFGETLLDLVSPSSDLKVGRGMLHGDYLLDSSAKGHAKIPSITNLSTILDSASMLRNLNQGPMSETNDSDERTDNRASDRDNNVGLHSRDSSVVTNSTTTASLGRDDAASASWMKALHSNTSLANDNSSPLTRDGAMTSVDPVIEDLPHPLSKLSGQQPTYQDSQALPMRRDESSMMAAVPNPSPAPVAEAWNSASGTATPSSFPSSPRKLQSSSTMASPFTANLRSPLAHKAQTAYARDSAMSSPVIRPEVSFSPFTAAVHTRSYSASTTGGLGTKSEIASFHRRHSGNVPTLPPSFRNAKPTPAQASVTVDSENGEDVLETLQKNHFVRTSFVMPISKGGLSCIKSSARTQVSLLRNVADLYSITPYDTVTVTKVDSMRRPFVENMIQADFLTMTFKVSRGEMLAFQQSFVNSWLYEGQCLSFDGIRTITKVIRHGDHVVRSGIMSEDTKLTFRSRSARIVWLIQMSYEMWDFASPYDANGRSSSASCKLYFDKFIDFVRRLFLKWQKLALTHKLSVVFFSRTFVRREEDTGNKTAVHMASDGRLYEDHYSIVLENETKANWDSLILKIKKAFVSYPKACNWRLAKGRERTPSTASQGNILEAINITLNLLHLHYIDRDLHRTGNSIVIITPGNGVFEIEKNLAGITKQRMMDNGIGSDMLSLSLPPLHVAPFFLYKEKNVASNTEEERTGFDEWKTYFEVPHWMNLSFVDYDNEDQEPTLYREKNIHEDPAPDEENDLLAQNWHASNGFKVMTPQPEIETSKYERPFDDILQACRPRNRGEFGQGLPTSLVSLITKFNGKNDPPDSKVDKMTLYKQFKPSSSPQRSKIMAGKTEWGLVDFDAGLNRWEQLQDSPLYGSPSSPTTSFMSLGGKSGMQTPMSLDDGVRSLSSEGEPFGYASKRLSSDGSSVALNDADSDASSMDINGMRKMMQRHDDRAFSSSPQIKKHRLMDAEAAILGNFNTSNEFISSSPKPETRGALRSQSTMFNEGGIGSALSQYDTTRKHRLGNLLEQRPLNVVFKEMPTRSLAVSPMSIGMPFSLERRSESLLRPSTASKLSVPPDQLCDNLRPIDTRKHSFHSHHNNHNKLPSREREPATQGAGRPDGPGGLNKPLSPIRTKNESKKHTSRSRKTSNDPRHNNRKHGLRLNPFRQQDENEVLAKRTHNRRRWSHVFPLGEDEFKRHAGPNWKSLCQPAVLPMTIDFHPSEQELQDETKYRIKEYSVILPQTLEDRRYESHKKLLESLVVQRMRQDFQLVPRSIIQKNPRRDRPHNPMLERTLSMGHKIQRLSYNPVSDSVDVVQYYALFAEDETPITYRYFLWSVLRQDYVPAVQTFTKYTLPYKWNEVDMLLSGDTSIATIQDGMRYPRISFIVIPDDFRNADDEEKFRSKFLRLIEYFRSKDTANAVEIDVYTSSQESTPKISEKSKRFVVDLWKNKKDGHCQWMEVSHDSNCDTRRTFRITIQWLAAVSSKIDQQVQLLRRRCSQYGLTLLDAPHFSCLRSCSLNPFAVPIHFPVRNKDGVDKLEGYLVSEFAFVFDGEHLSDPNELDCLDGFDFIINKWSMKKKKKFVKAFQYVHRTGTLFARLLRDSNGYAIVILYANQRHIAGDSQLLQIARSVFRQVELCIEALCKSAG